MRRGFSRILLAVCSVCLALGTFAHAQSANLSSQQIDSIRSLIKKTMDAHLAPGASFAIGLGGKITWSEGFGYADVENQVKATPDTAYRTASIGKPMTATAALKLVEQGKLDLSVPIQTYCPRYPEKPWPVTAARPHLAHQRHPPLRRPATSRPRPSTRITTITSPTPST